MKEEDDFDNVFSFDPHYVYDQGSIRAIVKNRQSLGTVLFFDRLLNLLSIKQGQPGRGQASRLNVDLKLQARTYILPGQMRISDRYTKGLLRAKHQIIINNLCFTMCSLTAMSLQQRNMPRTSSCPKSTECIWMDYGTWIV